MQNNSSKKQTADLLFVKIYGLNIKIDNRAKIVPSKLRRRVFAFLPTAAVSTDELQSDFVFTLLKNKVSYELRLDDETIISPDTEDRLLDFLETRLRVTVAEFAVGKVFLHAGVIAWNGSAIIIPAKSFQGKTTLVAELVRRGAVYYSDEYAVLDGNALVYPYPKTLSVRGIVDDFTQTEMACEEFGGTAGSEPLPVGMVLITEFSADAKWQPEILKPGAGIMELLPHTFPTRLNPKFTLNTLNNLANRAIIVKTLRGEANKFAELILEFFEKQTGSTTLKTDN